MQNKQLFRLLGQLARDLGCILRIGLFQLVKEKPRSLGGFRILGNQSIDKPLVVELVWIDLDNNIDGEWVLKLKESIL
jgi:hypothetical protein